MIPWWECKLVTDLEKEISNDLGQPIADYFVDKTGKAENLTDYRLVAIRFFEDMVVDIEAMMRKIEKIPDNEEDELPEEWLEGTPVETD